MKKLLVAAALAAAFCAGPGFASENESDDGTRSLTFAAFGDWPYNNLLLANADLLTGSINADRGVQLALHVGDIHSGSQPCTSAGILPPIATSNPGWNQAVFQSFQKINVPVVYTPGDNEWVDCHKSKEFASGDPLKELASVRGLFFSRPGITLGVDEMEVTTQAKNFDPAFPDDKQFVENVMFLQSRVMFVTLNVPGSNNDTLPWTGAFANSSAQAAEALARNAANQRWLSAAFAQADRRNAKALVIGLQADMWDPAAAAPGGDGLTAYTPLVNQIATLALKFGKPVLLINGDTHLYGVDQPLAVPSSPAGLIHKTPAVPNLTRVTVQGSTNAPSEWLRVSVDLSRNPAAFSFVNVPYCKNPLLSCN